MSIKKTLAPLFVGAALASVPAISQAALIAQITNGSSTLNVSDNGAGDLNGASGSIAYFGSFQGWEVTAAFGTSVTDPFQMHLSSIVSGNIGDGSLTLKLTQTNLVADQLPFWFGADGGGSGAWGSTGSWSVFVDDSNAAFGQGTLVHSSSGYGTSAGNIMASLSGLYSATIVTTFNYSNVASLYAVGSSLDVTAQVPEPASLGLLGLALMGVGAARFRRKA